jgi:Zn finger protein HypA/HybF involved in hydrogenase expression
MAKQIICKSCQVPCIADGNEITCTKCGTTFVKQGDTVKVKTIGRIDSIEQRISNLEKITQTKIDEDW